MTEDLNRDPRKQCEPVTGSWGSLRDGACKTLSKMSTEIIQPQVRILENHLEFIKV